MLVLQRMVDEEILIITEKETIVVKVVQVRGDRVRIGIEASRDTPVHRREVWEAIQKENEAAKG
jgi:carbon storage regulator